MKKIIFFFGVLVVSCNGNTQNQNSVNNLISANSPCFDYTDPFYSRVSNENIDEIVSGYLKTDFAKKYAYSIVKEKGQKPSIFIINYNDKGKLVFTSLKNDNSKWCPNWSNKISKEVSNYFAVSDGKINFVLDENAYDTTDYTALKVEGCYAHMCNTDNGLFYYNLKEQKGYLAIFSTEPIANSYPFGVPSDYKTLQLFEKQIIAKMTQPEHIANLMGLPKERKIPSIDFNSKELNIDDIIIPGLKNYFKGFKKEDYQLGYTFLFDYDGDKKVDIVFRLVQQDFKNEPTKMKNGYYLYSKNKLSYLNFGYSNKQIEELSISENPSDEILYYIDADKNEYLIITTTSTGNFNGAEIKSLNILKRVGDTFTFINPNNTQLTNRIVKKFRLEKSEYYF